MEFIGASVVGVIVIIFLAFLSWEANRDAKISAAGPVVDADEAQREAKRREDHWGSDGAADAWSVTDSDGDTYYYGHHGLGA